MTASKADVFLATRADAARRGDHGVVRAMNAELARLGVPNNSGEVTVMVDVKGEIAELLGQAQAKVGQLNTNEHDRGRVIAGLQAAAGALSTIDEPAPAPVEPAPPLPQETPEGAPQTETPESPTPAPADDGAAAAEQDAGAADSTDAAATDGAAQDQGPAKKSPAKKSSAKRRSTSKAKA